MAPLEVAPDITLRANGGSLRGFSNGVSQAGGDVVGEDRAESDEEMTGWMEEKRRSDLQRNRGQAHRAVQREPGGGDVVLRAGALTAKGMARLRGATLLGPLDSLACDSQP
jgi:hypothetical protein